MAAKKRSWSDLSTGQKAVVVVIGSAQLGFAVSAWADLATRPAEQVEGSKLKWAAVIAIDFVGPVLYFTRGRRHLPGRRRR
ncbi:hypothetical protein [Georgenia subflava]|uniref:hypothetical protein n=1 Tax=Georgenia subflava TaxID=1622177 RepID=UPI00126482E3|nr:hypothetical protein [Georgenia subflava]